ncbi:stage II sporulation protein P [Bacillus sp. 03113]|uniref:stage II sporulation protein P n=1 Tax=Bacillus sp. 03113 TaxID=2578211 RepID=UPI0011444919|nr:stage II sporulation protein P [Bacillus sp. 03113]
MKSKATNISVTIRGTSLIKLVAVFSLFLMMIFSISGLLTSLKPSWRISSSSLNHATTKITGDMLYQIVGMENHLFLESLPDKHSSPQISNYLFKLTTNISLNDPRSLLGRELPAFSLYDGKILVAGEGTNYTNMPIESSPPMDILKKEKEATLQNTEGVQDTEKANPPSSPLHSTGDKKVVYVYFSHTRESFLPYLKGVTNPDLARHSQMNVSKIGDKLQEELQSRGIGTTVDKTDIETLLNKKGWTYNQSYQESREVVQNAMTRDRNLTYLIDIHRDSRRREHTTKIINGVPYAKLAFIIGAENQNYEKNVAFAKELHERLDKEYKGLSRGIIEKKGAETNGKFNQDLSSNAILIEFGGVDNTFEELNRSAAILAQVFSEYYWQAESVNSQVKP